MTPTRPKSALRERWNEGTELKSESSKRKQIDVANMGRWGKYQSYARTVGERGHGRSQAKKERQSK